MLENKDIKQRTCGHLNNYPTLFIRNRPVRSTTSFLHKPRSARSDASNVHRLGRYPIVLLSSLILLQVRIRLLKGLMIWTSTDRYSNQTFELL